MSVQFGIITTSGGIASVVINSLKTNESAEIAEARNEQGRVTDIKAYSKEKTVTIDGLLNDSACTATAGDSITIGGSTYLITSCGVTESNKDFAGVSISAKSADSATIAEYE